MIPELNQRSQDIFRLIVDAYLDTGEPVGSRTLAKRLTDTLSPATIRNVMQDLEELGLLYAPHTSAGRLPTETGLRLFVDGLMEVGALNDQDRQQIDTLRNSGDVFETASTLLSGLSACAGVVMTPTSERPVRSIQFTQISQGRALVIIITGDGTVENRLMDIPLGLPPSALIMAGNFLTERLQGRTWNEARRVIHDEIATHQTQLDTLTQDVVTRGLATSVDGGGTLIVRGTAKLLDDVRAMEDLERIRSLFDALERRETMLRLLEAAQSAGGIRIFIGAENQIFGNAGLSMIVSPYKDANHKVVGAIGVIGPTRVQYGRIIPVVDYTSQILARVLGG